MQLWNFLLPGARAVLRTSFGRSLLSFRKLLHELLSLQFAVEGSRNVMEEDDLLRYLVRIDMISQIVHERLFIEILLFRVDHQHRDLA